MKPGLHSLQVLLFIVVVLVVAYIAAYPVLRVSKVLVRHETYIIAFKTGHLESRILPGRDMRSTGTGAMRNAVAPYAAWIYTPLRTVEEAIWNAN